MKHRIVGSGGSSLRGLLAAVLAALALPCGAELARAAASDADARGRASSPAPFTQADRNAARQHFDRGLALYNSGDLLGALAELRLANQRARHPVVLYNLALVYARLGHAAEAVETLEQLGPEDELELEPGQVQRARSVHRAQLARVATLEVKTDAPGARIRIGSDELGPSRRKRLSAGRHSISIWAPGHEPRHLEVSLKPGTVEVFDVALQPLLEPPARLKLGSNVPSVEVRVDAALVGRTPLLGELILRPGTHVLELSREGYVPVRRQVSLQPASQAELEMEMSPSQAGLLAGGTLVIDVSENDAVVRVNGAPRLGSRVELRLPVGRHAVRVERAGFLEVKREVMVSPGRSVIGITLLPTADHLAAYVSRTRAQRVASYVTLGAGALLTAGSAAFLVWNQGQKNATEEELDRFSYQVSASPSGGCETRACQSTLSILVDDLEQKRQRDVFGWVGLGIGAAALGSGFLLYALGDDPKRYELAPESDVFGKPRGAESTRSRGLRRSSKHSTLRLRVGARTLELSGRF